MNSYPKCDIDFVREHGNAWLWTGERVLITGATGFIGSWLAQVFDHQCELTLSRDFVDGEYDSIFHFAPTPIEPVIECARRHQATVTYTSSGAVYGGAPQQVDEDAPIIPKTEYGREKARSEALLAKSGLDYRILRIFATAGPGMRDYFAITAFVNAVKAGKPMEIYGRGKTVRSYLYIADLLTWMLRIIDFGRPGAYNVGSERETTIKELAELVASYATPHQPIEYSNKEFVEPAPYYVPDCGKAHKLGLYQWHDLEYGIRRMME